MDESSSKKARTNRSRGKKQAVPEVDEFFSQEQRSARLALFSKRKQEPHKFINLSWFLENGFVFPRWLIDQHLEVFCYLSENIYPKLVEEFYANLVNRNGKWITEVRNKRISISEEVLEQTAALQNSGESFFDLSRNKWEGFNSLDTFLECKRPNKRYDGKLMGAGLLKVNERLLHYILVYILVPRPFNKAQLNHEDLRFLFALKNQIQVNWADIILGHMLRKHKDSTSVLPYPALISRLIVKAGVNVTNEAKLIFRKGADKIDSLTLKKMKIVRVNGIWNWLEDTLPGAQTVETASDDEEGADIPDSSHAQNPSSDEAMFQTQGLILEQLSHFQEVLAEQNKEIDQLKERQERMNTLIESLVASKEREASGHPPSKLP